MNIVIGAKQVTGVWNSAVIVNGKLQKVDLAPSLLHVVSPNISNILESVKREGTEVTITIQVEQTGEENE